MKANVCVPSPVALHHARLRPSSSIGMHKYLALTSCLYTHSKLRCEKLVICQVDRTGKCVVIGAGPGPPDLLTVRAVSILRQAEVIVYDDLGAQEAVKQYASPTAELVYVGKRGNRESVKQESIDSILLHYTLKGSTVVRLKGGCPSVFSRLHSELAALSGAGVAVEIVPGVSSVLAAPLAAGFPLTHPHLSQGFLVASAHAPELLDWQHLAAADTLVLLMAGSTLDVVMQRLECQGKPGTTPVVIVQNASLEGQRVWQGTVGSIVEQTAGEALSPCIVIVGEVCRLAALDQQDEILERLV